MPSRSKWEVYRGFAMSVSFDAFRQEYTLQLKGPDDPSGHPWVQTRAAI